MGSLSSVLKAGSCNGRFTTFSRSTAGAPGRDCAKHALHRGFLSLFATWESVHPSLLNAVVELGATFIVYWIDLITKLERKSPCDYPRNGSNAGLRFSSFSGVGGTPRHRPVSRQPV